MIYERCWQSLVAWTIVGLAYAGCSTDLVLGEWACADAGVAASDDVMLPWSTGFESRFCAYAQPDGFCYAAAAASFSVVTEPVHSGSHAAAFKVKASGLPDGHQTRCVRQGVLPAAAYYGAWYLIPEPVESSARWNLWHFRGGDDDKNSHGLWDVSLIERSPGMLELIVYDFLNGRTHRAASAKPVPIGAWFHIELYLKRSADRTGEIALYQDDELLVSARNLQTDDTAWGQWYVGNLATGLTPPDVTVFVDDVSIRSLR